MFDQQIFWTRSQPRKTSEPTHFSEKENYVEFVQWNNKQMTPHGQEETRILISKMGTLWKDFFEPTEQLDSKFLSKQFDLNSSSIKLRL